MRSFAALVVLVAACTADAPSQSGPTQCTGVLYDPCNDEHSCGNLECDAFSDVGPVCSQHCTQGASDCPDDNGAPVTCDASNLCHPAAAHDCTIVQ
jgi:hypothetical protein